MKNLFFLGLFLSVFTFSHAQTELWLGPKAGFNLANVSNLDGNSYMGVYGGVAFGIHFSERYALQPEMGFSMQGSTEIYNSNEDLQLTYFTLGVIYRINRCNGGTCEFFLSFSINTTICLVYADYYSVLVG